MVGTVKSAWRINKTWWPTRARWSASSLYYSRHKWVYLPLFQCTTIYTWGVSTFKSNGTVRYNFVLTCLDNRSKRPAATGAREVQTFLEGHWAECSLPIRIFATSYVSTGDVNETQAYIPTVVFSLSSAASVTWIESPPVLTGTLHLFVIATSRISFTNFKSKY